MTSDTAEVTDATRTKQQKAVAVVLCTLFAIVVFRTAWLCDDAYITLRTVRNFLEGEGLRWNLVERVQVYTHPLWMFLLTCVYALTGEGYYAILLPSMALAVGSAWILASRIAQSTEGAALAVMALVFSKAFTDFATSGLENPLTFFLLAVFIAMLSSRKPSLRLLWQLAFVASLMALNRQDTILLVFPALLYVWYNVSWKAGAARLLMGFVPLIAWELFSLFYYGFPFPNTAYAKLSTGIESGVLIAQGLSYLLNSLRADPLTLAVCVVALGMVAYHRQRKSVALAVGMVLYLLYTVKVGGDFMSGRFLAAPFFVGAALLSQALFSGRNTAWWSSVALVLLLGLASPTPPVFSQAEFGASREGLFDANGVADERAFYYRRTGLLKAGRKVRMPDVAEGYLNPEYNKYGMIVQHNTGMMGFYGAKRDALIVDEYALSDPLMARLPVTGEWRIGHFKRSIPPGYIETLATGENRFTNRDLGEYYKSIQLITRGPLLSAERLKEIVMMNLGFRDHLLDSYTASR